mgnify:CR=1 FL=1
MMLVENPTKEEKIHLKLINKPKNDIMMIEC